MLCTNGQEKLKSMELKIAEQEKKIEQIQTELEIEK